MFGFWVSVCLGLVLDVLTSVIYVLELLVVLGDGQLVGLLKLQVSPFLDHLSFCLGLDYLLRARAALEAIKLHLKIALPLLSLSLTHRFLLYLPFAPTFSVLADLLQYFFGHFPSILIPPKKRSP